MTPPLATRCGHIALAGAPNVGKSTLLNAMVGSHLAIVSPKMQSTRLPVTGLVTTADTQFIFHDLPGLMDPKYPLQARMRFAALEVLHGVQVILHLHPAPEAPAPPFPSLMGADFTRPTPVLTVYTMADRGADAARLLPSTAGGPVLTVSAHSGEGLPELLEAVRQYLPHTPFMYAPDDVGTQPVRFFAAEYLREAAFELLSDEVPYALAAEIEEFREEPRPIYVRVTLWVERESQKGIVIGRGARTLKEIGRHARARLESLLGEQVYLDCHVKVLPRWRRNASALDRLGFPPIR